MLRIIANKYKQLQSHFPVLQKFLPVARVATLYLVLPAVLTIGMGVALVVPGVITEIRHFRLYSFEKFSDIAAKEFLRSAGWIPSWLPPSSTDIFLAYSVDERIPSEGQEWIVFRFPPSDSFYEHCLLLDRERVRMPYVWTPLSGLYRDVAERFLPDFIKDLVTTVQQDEAIRFYRCHRNADKILAVDHLNSKGYIWDYHSLPRIDFDVMRYSFKSDFGVSDAQDEYNNTELLQFIPERAEGIEIYNHKYSDELWALFYHSRQAPSNFFKKCQEIPMANADIPSRHHRYWRPLNAMKIIDRVESHYGRSAFYRCGRSANIYLAVTFSESKKAVLWKDLYAGEPLP